MFGFELIGGQVVERLVETLGIVKGFDVSEHAEPRVCQIVIVSVVDPLVFKGLEESFHHGVIITAAGAAHRKLDARAIAPSSVVGKSTYDSSRICDIHASCVKSGEYQASISTRLS